MEPTQGGMQAREFRGNGAGTALHYLLYLPEGYDTEPGRRWPLVLFLHGSGERGNDLALVLAHGMPRRLQEGMEFPGIVVSPQCPANERWSIDALAALLDELERTLAVDRDQLLLTGLSLGGFATWALAIAQPHRFAALAPVCGGGDPTQVCAIAHLPIWAFHGAQDDVVPLVRSQEMVDALHHYGSKVRFTVYPDAGHDSWTETYANPELYQWLLAQRRQA